MSEQPAWLDSVQGDQTCAIIKPDAVGRPWLKYSTREEPDDEGNEVEVEFVETLSKDKSSAIIERIKDEGFEIEKSVRTILSVEQAKEFYKQHAEKPFFKQLVEYMTSGPIIALKLKKANAIASFRELLGPTDSAQARAEEEKSKPEALNSWCLRAAFGKDKEQNACHGSDSKYSAEREIDFFFPEAKRWERTFAMIITDDLDGGVHYSDVIEKIEENNLVVCNRRGAELTPELAQIFEKDNKLDETFSYATGKQVIGLAIEGHNCIKRWLQLIGPEDRTAGLLQFYSTESNKAGRLFYGSSSKAEADHQLDKWFPDAIAPERALAIVLPQASETKMNSVYQEIESHNFTIVSSTRLTVSETMAEKLFELSPDSYQLRNEIKGKTIFAMVLSKPGAIATLRLLVKSTVDTNMLKNAPDSLEAKLGKYYIYASPSEENASETIRVLFPRIAYLAEGIKDAAAAKEHIMKRKAQLMPLESDQADAGIPTLQGLLTDGLVELCRQKPDGLEAVRWLGNWLLMNNPNQDAVGRAHLDMVKKRSKLASLTKNGSKPKPSGEISLPSLAEKQIIFVLGEPGSGKREQCEKLSRNYGFTHLNTGDILKAESESGSEVGNQILDAIKNSKNVDLEIAITLLKKTMRRSKNNKFLIDGFPRDMEQALKFEQQIAPCDFVLYFECPDDVLIERLKEREEGIAQEKIEERIRVLRERAKPVIEHYRNLGKVKRINSTYDVERVFESVHRLVEPEVIFVLGGPGAGKGSVCALMEQQFGYVHLCAGDLLREEAKKGTEEGQRIKSMITNGQLIPTAMMMSLMKRTMATHPSNKFVLDGFPRSLKQCAAFESTVASAKFALHLVGNKDTLRSRAQSGSDSLHFNKRYKLYKENEMSVVENFRSQGRLREVKTDGCTLDQVLNEVKPFFQIDFVLAYGQSREYVFQQCNSLSYRFGHTHLSLDDLINAEIKHGSNIGDELNAHISKSEEVPIPLKIRTLRQAIVRSKNSKFFIQDFPCTKEEACQFEEYFGKPSKVITFNTKEDGYPSGINEILDVWARGILRSFDCISLSSDRVLEEVSDFMKPDIVYVVGNGSLSPTETFDLVKKLAEEQEYVAIDTKEAFHKATSSNPGPWFNNIISKENEHSIRPKVRSTEEQTAAEEEATRARLALLENAPNASGKRGMILVGYPETAEDVKNLNARFGQPKRIIDLRCPSSFIRKRFIAENPEAEDAVIEQMVVSHENHVDNINGPILKAFRDLDSSTKITPVSTTRNYEDISQQLRAQFQAEIVVMIGSKGVGKDEICTELAKKKGYVRLHTKTLFEAEIERGTYNGKIIKKHLDSNRSIPLEVIIPVIRSAARASGGCRFLLDGLPRLIGDGYPFVHDQVFAIEQSIGPVLAVLHFVATDEVRKSREEDAAAVAKSVDLYKQEKLPAVEFFTELDKVAEIDANLDMANIYNQCIEFIDKMKKKSEAEIQLGNWTPGDGSPQALLQEVFDMYNPDSQAINSAEEYYERFTFQEDGNLPFTEVQAKMEEWQLEASKENNIFDNKDPESNIAKHEWFQFYFSSVILLDPVSENDNEDTAENTEEANPEAEAEA